MRIEGDAKLQAVGDLMKFENIIPYRPYFSLHAVKRFGEKYFEITSRGIAVKTIREKGLFTALSLAKKKKRE